MTFIAGVSEFLNELYVKSKKTEVLPAIVDEGFKNEWVEGLADDSYHADKTAVSSTSLRYVLKSELYFYRSHCLGLRKPATKAMNFGKAAHMAMLEPRRFESIHVVMPDFGDMRSSSNRSKRDAWLAELPKDALVLSQEERDKLMWMIDSLLRHEIAVNLLKDAAFEQTGYFRDSVTGLKCRFKPDIIRPDLSAMPDIKTTRDASKAFFSKEIWNHRYDVQLAFYSMGVEMIHGKPPEFPCFIAVENESPFDVCVYAADEGMMSRGQASARKCLDRIARCLETGNWYGYQPQGAENIGLPAFTDFIEE